MSKIRYEITVDVTDVDIKTKKKVQDALRKLGIETMTPDRYCDLDKDGYTNMSNSGRLPNYIMYVKNRPINPTHTIDELMELAGMKTKTDLKPFDLERALKGEPVALRNGCKAYIRHHEKEFETSYPLIGYEVHGTGGSENSWTVEGNFFAYKEETASDIVGMWTEPLVFEFWDLISKDIQYMAKDSNGRWFGYEREPTQSSYEDWDSLGDFVGTGIINPKLFPECDWKDSLIKRPEND